MKGIDKRLIIFTTKKRFNDRNADDMQSGDMDVDTLKKALSSWASINFHRLDYFWSLLSASRY
ncbi:DUF3289 family protein [Pantoea septica]|uniref:DUF3289 family protein n=1 Tax=Pantoea septica TaxID=472695 RepID=UPI003D003192